MDEREPQSAWTRKVRALAPKGYQLDKVYLEGRVVALPIVSKTPGGTPVTNIIVVQSGLERDPDSGPLADPERKAFRTVERRLSVVVYGHLAEVVAEYVQPGRQVRVVGKLDPCEDHMVIAEHVEFRPERAKLADDPEAVVEEVTRAKSGKAPGMAVTMDPMVGVKVEVKP